MLRLPPSQIELTRKEVRDFLDRHEKKRALTRHASAGTWAQNQLRLSALTQQPLPRVYRGAERSRDDSLTDSTLVASSPSAAINDEDEFELEDSEEYDSEDGMSYQASLVAHADTQSIRRDSAMSQEVRITHESKPAGHPSSDSVGSLQLDGSAAAADQAASPRGGSARLGPEPRRNQLRSSSDPGEPLPVAIQRYRPHQTPRRTHATSNIPLRSRGNIDDQNTSLDDVLADGSSVTYRVLEHRQSPLEELAAGAARLNIQNSIESVRRPPSSVTQFPDFEDYGSRSVSDTAVLAHEAHSSAALLDRTGISLEAISSTTLQEPATLFPSAADRLRAFADSFAIFRRRSPQRRQEQAHRVLARESSPAPDDSTTTMPSPGRSRNSSNTQASRPPRLTELAIAPIGRSSLAASSRPTGSARTRRITLDAEQENNEDTTELEQEARNWRQRMETAPGENGEDRTPPRQGRFLARILR